MLPVFACVLTCSLAVAQKPDLEPQRPDAPVPTVTFTRNWPQAMPEYYSISVEQTGRAAYQSNGKVTADAAPGDPYFVKFTMSAPTRRRIFDLARQADYFRGKFDFKKGNIANTGAKTLSYAEGERRSETSYNWSQDAAIQQLTTIFENISVTLESGRRLAYLYRHDKLGLDLELKNMQQAAQNGSLPEVQTVEPVLKQIAQDPAVMRIARQRAQALLGNNREIQ
jgi:hypothetical protein